MAFLLTKPGTKLSISNGWSGNLAICPACQFSIRSSIWTRPRTRTRSIHSSAVSQAGGASLKLKAKSSAVPKSSNRLGNRKPTRMQLSRTVGSRRVDEEGRPARNAFVHVTITPVEHHGGMNRTKFTPVANDRRAYYETLKRATQEHGRGKSYRPGKTRLPPVFKQMKQIASLDH